jgi:hypothetical protein
LRVFSQAIQLPEQYEIGKLAAYRLVCLLTVQPLDISLPKQHLTLFYRAVHSGIASNDSKILHVLVKYTGPRLFSLNLPGSSLLTLDYIHAANVILSSQDIEVFNKIYLIMFLNKIMYLPFHTYIYIIFFRHQEQKLFQLSVHYYLYQLR